MFIWNLKKNKKWSTRKLGYEELIKSFKDAEDPNDTDFELFLNLAKESARFTNDSIEPAREKGIEAVLVFLESISPLASKYFFKNSTYFLKYNFEFEFLDVLMTFYQAYFQNV